MSDKDGIRQIDVPEARQLIIGGAVLLDVREPDEWQAGHAPEARHLPMAEVPEGINDLPASEIIVVCRSGARSQRIALFLTGQGYTASNLAGGMQAWAANGLPVVTDDESEGTII